jgi:hypothetical protein
MARYLGAFHGGAWSPAKGLSVFRGGSWMPAKNGWAYRGGVWEQFWPVAPPATPTVAWVSAGVFTVTNFDSSLVYDASPGGVLSGSSLAVPAVSGSTVVTVRRYAGGPGVSVTVARQPHTFRHVEGACIGWSGPDEFGWYYCNNRLPGSNALNDVPGWANTGSEWWRLT